MICWGIQCYDADNVTDWMTVSRVLTVLWCWQCYRLNDCIKSPHSVMMLTMLPIEWLYQDSSQCYDADNVTDWMTVSRVLTVLWCWQCYRLNDCIKTPHNVMSKVQCTPISTYKTKVTWLVDTLRFDQLSWGFLLV